MTDRFDPAKAKTYFSSNFLKNHIFVGSAGQKKKAENVFQRRGKEISTVICVTPKELAELAGEVYGRQAEYARNKTYVTQKKYDYWKRGGDKGKDKQRASAGNGKFKYSVREEGGKFVMCHFESLA